MTSPLPAAQYLRMSTDHQQYSLDNQAQAIARYAAERRFVIVKTYSDAGKSGLHLSNRQGLKQLLTDVLGEQTEFRTVLVYDVSRWGRFQNDDQAAHYEFLCKKAGIPVYYCAESFENDNSMAANLMKSLKRLMASEYSRELSVKTFAGQARIAKMGFKIGGSAGYGLRRLMISADGKHRRILRTREYKSVKTDRVVLVAGPRHEVELVRKMYSMALRGMGCSDIARELKRQKVPRENARPWNCEVVRTILTHPKYMGCNVWGQTSQKLHGPPLPIPRERWIVRPKSFAGIIDPTTFNRVQHKLRQYAANLFWTDEEILLKLRTLWRCKGKISETLIDDTPGMPSYCTVLNRFGSLAKAYELTGYKPAPHALASCIKKTQTHRLRNRMIRRLLALFPNLASARLPGKLKPMLVLDGHLVVSVKICPARECESGIVWQLSRKKEPDVITFVARCKPDMEGFHSLYVFPRREWRSFYRFRGDPEWLSEGIRLNSLSEFGNAVRRCSSRKMEVAWLQV